MRMTQSISQKLEMQQTISQKMLQSLKILQMDNFELETAVKETALENPLLEWNTARKSRLDYEYFGGVELHDNYGASVELSIKEQLNEHLLFVDFDENMMRKAKLFIESLDDKGFLDDNLGEWLNWAKVDLEEFKAIQKGLSEFAPGVGTKNTFECLMYQIHPDNILLKSMVLEDLSSIAGKDYELLAKKYDKSVFEIAEEVRSLSKLSPYPFFGLSDNSLFSILPIDAILSWENGWKIELVDNILGSLTIDLKALDHLLGNKEADKYISEKIREAESLIYSIKERNSTLIRCINLIADKQTRFLRGLDEHPLAYLQKELAEELELNPSTTSRAIKDKYIKTPRGIVKLSDCFLNPISDKDQHSKYDVMREIDLQLRINRSLTDQALTDILNSKGISIKRRTVNKYRNKLKKRQIFSDLGY